MKVPKSLTEVLDFPLYVLVLEGSYCVKQIVVCFKDTDSVTYDQDFSTGFRLIKDSLDGFLNFSVESVEVRDVVLEFGDAKLLILSAINRRFDDAKISTE